MNKQARNQLILMSDEHTRKVLGCYGNTHVQTPFLDALARRGTRFTDAYTPIPICVPARAAFATGQYGHQTRHWDNATPYSGSPPSWAHHLQAADVEVGSIGKLHYRNDTDEVGFDFQESPMHVVNGVGDVLGCIREPLPKRWKSHAMAENIGPGETSYTKYDRSIAATAANWLKRKSSQGTSRPWVLYVSLVAPHFPLIAPQKYYDLYADLHLSPTKKQPDATVEHGWIQAMRSCILYDNFTPERTTTALTAYYGLVSFMDANVGKVLTALSDSIFSDNTQVIYTSDHGDNIGERGLWGKSNMYEESVGVPLIIAGPDIPENTVCGTPVSILDIAPTILETAGVESGQKPMQGKSLIDLANEPDDSSRVVFSEYHAMGSPSGAFMIRKGQWKLVHYVGYSPQLFNLAADPEELTDLGDDAEFNDIRRELTTELMAICDPRKVDNQAKLDQQSIVSKHGGADAVIKKGGFGATPPPGENTSFA